jgi:hypothetical protein
MIRRQCYLLKEIKTLRLFRMQFIINHKAEENQDKISNMK